MRLFHILTPFPFHVYPLPTKVNLFYPASKVRDEIPFVSQQKVDDFKKSKVCHFPSTSKTPLKKKPYKP